AELFAPIERRQILRDAITAIAAQIFKIPGAKIVDYRESRVGKFFLERKREIGADKAGATGDDNLWRRIGCSHGGHYSAAKQICPNFELEETCYAKSHIMFCFSKFNERGSSTR